MCDIATIKTEHGNGTCSIDFSNCSKSGKPMTVTNELGMWCEDMCDYEETKKKMDSLMGLITSIFGEDFDGPIYRQDSNV